MAVLAAAAITCLVNLWLFGASLPGWAAWLNNLIGLAAVFFAVSAASTALVAWVRWRGPKDRQNDPPAASGSTQ